MVISAQEHAVIVSYSVGSFECHNRVTKRLSSPLTTVFALSPEVISKSKSRVSEDFVD